MSKSLTIDLDEAVSDLLAQAVQQCNEASAAAWTPETLAASFLAHLLIDDCECGETRH